MVFSSSLFLFYFLPVFLLIYFFGDKRYRNHIALAGSLVFYFWGAPLFSLVVIGMLILDYFLAGVIHRLHGEKKKDSLIIAVVLNVAVLLFFQYETFFVDNVNKIFGSATMSEIKWMKYFVPLGISFITFRQLSYLIDVYRGDILPEKRLDHYAIFVLLFPQLINGPIIRYDEIAGQIKERSRQYNIDEKLLGFVRFIMGLAKKVLIADVLGVEVDRIFALKEADLTTPLAWTGAIAFTFQIYFDFAGYTDMAIGLGRMMGFRIPENFNSPYISQSITEFWRRWHMTLSRWLRDYLFTPMALSMRNWKVIGSSLALLITFTLCGMWHKPGWTFILWGAYYGVLLILDQLFLLKLLKRTGRLPSVIITFFLTMMGWVLFRGEYVSTVSFYIKKMFAFDMRHSPDSITADFWVMLILAALLSFIPVFRFGERLRYLAYEKPYNIKRLVLLGTATVLVFIICVGSITGSGFNPFIYFRF